MPINRRRKGFERAGALPLDRLGLPRGRACEMVLAQAWKQVAGPALAARTRALRIQRGVLEIEVACGRWSETLGELLPRLAGRLARLYPEMAVRKFRLIRSDSNERGLPQAIEISSEPTDASNSRVRSVVQEPTVEDRRPQHERLEELARRYVERDETQNQ